MLEGNITYIAQESKPYIKRSLRTRYALAGFGGVSPGTFLTKISSEWVPVFLRESGFLPDAMLGPDHAAHGLLDRDSEQE